MIYRCVVPMPAGLHSRTLAKAAHILGGIDALTQVLGVPRRILDLLLNGKITVPPAIFMQACEIVTDAGVADSLRPFPADDPCPLCIDLVGASRRQEPHDELRLENDRSGPAVFRCVACQVCWTCGPYGWARSVDVSLLAAPGTALRKA